ncbi:serine/threonine protein phosphatase [Paraburkholderia sp. Ac-20342]|uniref:hypothetical protein n=1 Tax=Paraburkholderia sp. Ac-20342 TaxID=2703889 RepID=UPI001980BF15|nr:hypothetical protein [Paraburkholderia sp. Ac-20342]MBN3845858.1 serine/threonine protein phosphatase [Paraburkholderia sp. Ac-20342]
MQSSKATPGHRFSIAVIPDTQNYTSHTQQREAGFPFNSREILWDMMHYIARNAVKNGGEIAFATGLGDMWQHPVSNALDREHAARGDKAVANPIIDSLIPPSPEKVVEVEIPAAKAAYEIIAGTLPFSVVPGNHDHDHLWTDANHPPSARELVPGDYSGIGGLHCGELVNWTRNFGASTPFFKGQPWYVASLRGGANSAQIFNGGGYRFLHLGMEMSPDSEVIEWAESVLAAFPGLPTIVSIHEFLNSNGRRESIECLDLSRLDPQRHDPERLWERFVSRHDPILAVLNGHFHGVQHRIDKNRHGHDVYQFLTNYQSRKQSLRMTSPDTRVIDGIGDGWLRLMEFDLDAQRPQLRLRAWSTYFKTYSSQLPEYGAWYRAEHPELSEAQIAALDDFTIELGDFHERFSGARIDGDVDTPAGTHPT